MAELVVVFGYGPVGRATVERLVARGQPVRVAQRTAPEDLPTGVAFQACDVLDPSAVLAAAQGAGQIVAAIGFPYQAALWRKAWPVAMGNLVAAAERTGARLVFFDNLYMYGPQRAPLREDMPLTSYGGKPAARSAATRIWMASSQAGRARIAALRAPDFYGPGVGNSHLGDLAFGALARGRSAMMISPPDTPHDFAYVPDLGRAVVSLLDAPDDAYGQAWHTPCAPTRTPREIFALGAAALGRPAKITALPLGLLPAMGLVSPMMREMAEMRFQWDRPYLVDWSRFAARFWSDPTPFEVGAPDTARAFQAAAAQARR